ncbi:hypothetical protein WJX72_008428 [[Myrmecia] bisecta]|uniref:ABC transporter domain-containing protein n=1 Tax=[Myrmecia] bisecta TaxID=41462 RepID=A0AAW1Q9T1_9CHLO
MQEDTFVPTLSVKETLKLYTDLRVPDQISKLERQALMRESIESMGLTKAINSQIGGVLPGGFAVKGLSGGERRRLNIACGTVAAPAIIFLDECTSGLDSHAALVLVQHLKKLASHQRTIVVAWFSGRLGFPYDPAHAGSVCDWALDLISIGFQKTTGGFTCLDDVIEAADRFAGMDALASYLAGFAVFIRDMIPFLRALSFLSPLRYTYAGLALLQFESGSACRGGIQGSPGAPCVDKAQVFDMRLSVAANIGALCGMLAGLHVLSYLCLAFLYREKR